MKREPSRDHPARNELPDSAGVGPETNSRTRRIYLLSIFQVPLPQSLIPPKILVSQRHEYVFEALDRPHNNSL